MQDRLLWFLHGFLRLNQSDQMLVQWFSLLSTLLTQHATLVWPLSTKNLDPKRCSAWWFELLRHLSFHRAETREAAMALVEKYHDPRLADRVFELAWTHSHVVLRQLDASEADAQAFGRLASSILYASSRRRAAGSVIARNRRGQSGLWGIVGVGP